MDIQTEEIKCMDSYTSMKKAKISVEVNIFISIFPTNWKKTQVDETLLYESSDIEEIDQKELIAFLQRTIPLIFEAIEENNTLTSLQSFSVFVKKIHRLFKRLRGQMERKRFRKSMS